MTNQFKLLRQQCIANSTREFLARGKSVARCESCQLAEFACICNWQPQLSSSVEFILLLHRNEVFKPTNTGRLIADLLPAQTHAFCWSRTEPDEALLKLLSDDSRQCFIVFPADTPGAKHKSREVFDSLPANGKLHTFILLDATWKQSGRMFHLSRWLEQVPCISLPQGAARNYAVRKSHQDDYLSTAEAAALCFELAGEENNSEALFNYFQVFNEHYLATRGSYFPAIGEIHKQLENLKRTSDC